MTVTHWYKQNVYDPADAKIGEIMNVLVDRQGQIVTFIVGAGGFLRMGRRTLPFPSMPCSSRRRITTSGIPS
jgi:hypothetical protein